MFLMANDVLTVMVCYDLLGLTSFLLIMYFKRQAVIGRAVVTLMINKLADLFLLFACVILVLVPVPVRPVSLIALSLAIMVKRAQLPFSS